MKTRYLFIIIPSLLLMSSCTAPRLYYWGSSPALDQGTSKYEKLAYKNYDKQSPESICELIVLYEDMITHPGGTRNTVPPGVYAEYGFLLLQPSTAEIFAKHATDKQKNTFKGSDYATLFSERGESMMQKEMELYPESAKFLGPLLKRLIRK